MEYTSDHSTDSLGSQESDGGRGLGRRIPQRNKGKQKKRQDSNDSAGSRGSDSSEGYHRRTSSTSAEFHSSGKQSGSQKGEGDNMGEGGGRREEGRGEGIKTDRDEEEGGR